MLKIENGRAYNSHGLYVEHRRGHVAETMDDLRSAHEWLAEQLHDEPSRVEKESDAGSVGGEDGPPIPVATDSQFTGIDNDPDSGKTPNDPDSAVGGSEFDRTGPESRVPLESVATVPEDPVLTAGATGPLVPDVEGE